MATLDEIQLFLSDFHAKMGIWGIVIRDDRGKNRQTLLDLEMTTAGRNTVLKSLVRQDYSHGPMLDTLNGGPAMWVFGKMVRGREIYIKITMGIKGAQVICISFHTSEYPMKYPYQQQKEVDA